MWQMWFTKWKTDGCHKMTDNYVMDIVNSEDALYVLIFVLAIDAEKCSRN